MAVATVLQPDAGMRTPSILSLMVAASLVAAVGCDKKYDKGGKTEKTTEGPPAALTGVAAGKKVFREICITCHTVGAGDRTGPDLKDVHKRRDHDWLVRWLKDPMGMQKTDPVGKELLAKFNNVPMPPFPLDDAQRDGVLEFLAAASDDPELLVSDEPFQTLYGDDMEKAKGIFFARCAGCHGTLRAGATGPNIQPARTRTLGTAKIKETLTNGLPGGMPAWGKQGILSPEEIDLMASFVQNPPPPAPPWPMDKVQASWKLEVPVADRPTKPVTKRNWQNFFGVVLRDAGQVAIIDGDTKEKIAIVPTGYAVHILRSSESGRYFYAVGRDGAVTLIDLWPEQPTVDARVRGCLEARSVDGSKFKGYEDKYVIEGCYWPPQYVVYDGETLEPKTVTNVLRPAYDDNEDLKEVRVAAIVASHFAPLWIANLKESGHLALIDYSKPDFPMVSTIPAERYLHDGGFDHTGRYVMMAANMRNQMVVLDVKEKKLLGKFETGIKPHPGRGANWQDPEYGWVNATTHIGEGKLTIYGADPDKRPDVAWKVVRTLPLPGPGGLFVKTHPKSKWVWTDAPLSNVPDQTRQICVYSKKDAKIEKCWTPVEHGRTVHFEYNKDGTEVWVSAWDKQGELIVYDDATLTEKTRIKGDWVVTPTGKFNVWNTSHDIY